MMDKPNKDPEKAVALKYERERDRAPKVTAKGSGEVARRIVEVARENNIPLHHDGNLAEVLSALELNSEIAPELYKAVAEVLAMLYSVNQQMTPR